MKKNRDFFVSETKMVPLSLLLLILLLSFFVCLFCLFCLFCFVLFCFVLLKGKERKEERGKSVFGGGVKRQIK